MSIAVIGGLLTSTILTLLVIPTVYLIIDDMKEKAGDLVFGSGKRRAMDKERKKGEPAGSGQDLEYSGGNQ